jgi:DNA-binding transcriptional regulator YdaS (Cro superfamily)
VPTEHCPLIEDLTEGRILCEDLRPDVRWDLVRKRRRPHPDRTALLAARGQSDTKEPAESVQAA